MAAIGLVSRVYCHWVFWHLFFNLYAISFEICTECKYGRNGSSFYYIDHTNIIKRQEEGSYYRTELTKTIQREN